MNRHKGKPRPFAARRFYCPRHCDCLRNKNPNDPESFFDVHLARTVAPWVPTPIGWITDVAESPEGLTIRGQLAPR